MTESGSLMSFAEPGFPLSSRSSSRLSCPTTNSSNYRASSAVSSSNVLDDFLGPMPINDTGSDTESMSSSVFTPSWSTSGRTSKLRSGACTPSESERSTPTPTQSVDGKWPYFQPDEIQAEQLIVKLVAERTAEGEVTMNGLYHKIAQSFGMMNKPNPFPSAVGLQNFITLRSHLFRYSIISSKVVRCGFGYTKGIMRIVQFVHDMINKFGRCSFEDLYNDCISPLPVYESDKEWNDEEVFEYRMSMHDAKKFLSEQHSDYFLISDTRIQDVSLKPITQSIPSLWVSSCVPAKPIQVYWDKSRVYTFSAYVVSSVKIYAKAVIQAGRYSNRSIYILASHIGEQEKDLSTYIPTSTMLTVRAHLSLNAKCDFTAVKLIPHGESKLSTRYLVDVNKELLSTLQPASSSRESYSSSHRADAQDMAFGRRALDSERKRINYMDKLLGNDELNPDEVHDRFWQTQAGAPFKLVGDLGEFITTRPHLYMVEHRGDTAFAMCLKNREREMCRSFLALMSNHRHGLTMTEIKQKLKGNEAGPPLQLLSLADSFGDWMDRLQGYILGKVDLDTESVLVLRGAYSCAEKLFVPNMPQSFV